MAYLALLQGQSLEIKLPIKDIKVILKTETNIEWKFFWENTALNEGKHLYNLLLNVPKRPWFNDIKLFRKIAVQLIRIRHAPPAHMHRIGILESSC